MDLLPPILLLSDSALVISTALLLLPAESESPIVFRLIHVFLYAIALIIFTGIILGLSGFLSVASAFIIHGVTFAVALDWRVRVERANPWVLVRQRWHILWNDLTAQVGKLVRYRDSGLFPWLTRILAGVVAVFVVMYFIQAIFAVPLNYDSNTYRLTRIAYWLQEGSIQHFSTNDPRHLFTPYYVDLLMLWAMSFFPNGFPLVNVVQTFGGVLLLMTLWGWGGLLSLPPYARFLAMLVCLGLPNVNLQFYTSQTDLFATGLTSSAILLLWTAFLQPDRISRWAGCGLAFGLAVGAKPTVLYWGPALFLLFIAWWFYHRTPITNTIRGGVTMGLVIMVSGGTPFLQNHAAFDSMFAPAEELAIAHHAPLKSRPDFAIKNLAAYSWQILEPNSNPRWLRPVSDLLYDRIGTHIHDWPVPSVSYQYSINLARNIYGVGRPNEDTASFGVIPMALMSCCMFILLLRPPRHVTRDCRFVVLSLGFAALGFVLLLTFTSSFTPFKYRYLILLTPAVSLAIAAVLSDRKSLSIGAVLLLALHFSTTAFTIGLTGIHHGLQTVFEPSRSGLFAHRKPLFELAGIIGPQPHPVGIALPRDSWIAPLFRHVNGPEYTFITLDQLERYSAVEELLLDRNLSGLIVKGDSELTSGPEIERLRYWIHTVFINKRPSDSP